MNYEDKYIKYKAKYLELKNIKAINQIGGGRKVLKIKDVTKNNFNHIIELNSGKDEYVASNSYTIIEAFFSKEIKYVKAIYLNNNPIGLIWFVPENKNEMFIHRFMIDQKFQGKGYGSIAFNLSLKYFINKYKLNKLIVSSKNQLALNLYKKFGFVDTGKIEYGENVLEVLTKDIIYLD